MYTFKQAIKDSKVYIDRKDNQELLKAVAHRDDSPRYREVILAVDEVYKLFYKRLLFKGALFKLYKPRKNFDDTVLIPKVVARKIIPMLVLFALCEDYMHPALESLREIISETMNLITCYIDVTKVSKKNYKEIQALEI